MHDLSVAVLCSGSSGNSTLFMSEGRGVLVDAGLSSKELERRLSAFGAQVSQIDAVVLTHEHTDHTRGAERFCSEHCVPLYGTKGTLALTPHGRVSGTRICAGDSFAIGRIQISPFRVKHLAAEPIGLTMSVDSKKVGFASDLGCVTDDVAKAVAGSDMILIEANYDDEMLMAGSYPDFLKRAIRSDHGHLSNDDAAALADKACSAGTKKVVLLHLSKENNTPQKARQTVRGRIRESGCSNPIDVVRHGSGSGPYHL